MSITHHASRITRLSVLFFAILLAGCKTSRFEPGGAYTHTNTAGAVTVDFALFYADNAFRAAHGTLDFAFKFEKDNRALLWSVSPDIKHGLDVIRPRAAAIVRQFATAREAYLLQPNPDSLSNLNGILDELQRLAAAAMAVVTTDHQP